MTKIEKKHPYEGSPPRMLVCVDGVGVDEDKGVIEFVLTWDQLTTLFDNIGMELFDRLGVNEDDELMCGFKVGTHELKTKSAGKWSDGKNWGHKARYEKADDGLINWTRFSEFRKGTDELDPTITEVLDDNGKIRIPKE